MFWLHWSSNSQNLLVEFMCFCSQYLKLHLFFGGVRTIILLYVLLFSRIGISSTTSQRSCDNYTNRSFSITCMFSAKITSITSAFFHYKSHTVQTRPMSISNDQFKQHSISFFPLYVWTSVWGGTNFRGDDVLVDSTSCWLHMSQQLWLNRNSLTVQKLDVMVLYRSINIACHQDVAWGLIKIYLHPWLVRHFES